MPLTPTSRLGLVNPDPNPVTGDFVDIAVINANNAKVDAAVGAFPCTVATRPLTPFHGQFIRETDTGRVYVRNTTAGTWDLVADPVAEYSAWITTFVPVWSANAGAPVLNDGTITCRYRVVGKTMDIRIKLTWGPATTAAGTGLWRVSLPFAPVADGLLNAYVDDGSASARWAGTARIIAATATGDNMRIVMQAATGGISGASSPMIWATTDILILSGTLELV